MRDPAGDPHRAVWRHYPDIIFRATNHRPVQGHDQLAFAVSMNRHFCRVINEIDMPRDGRARRTIGIKQGMGESGWHLIGNI